MVVKRALLVMVLCACAPAAETQPDPNADPESPPEVAPASTIGVGDVFDVRVFNEEELSGTHRVDSDGAISVPLAGRVKVAGMSPGDIGSLLEERFSEYLRNPQVTVFVKEFNSKKIYVLGEVKRPGTFIYEDGMSVVQAITLAGGFDTMAEKNGTYVTRLIDGKEQQIEVPVEDIGEGRAKNFLLIPGDIVYVPESLF